MAAPGPGGGSGRALDHPRVLAALAPGAGWSDVVHLDEVTSTHDVALQRLRAGAAPGLVVVGDRQTAGRGRAGRGWEDGPSDDASLMFTATVTAPAGELTLAPLAAGLAVVDAAADEAGVVLQLKWPNDVVAGSRKCVGILVEHHALPPPAGAVLLVGIGIDVDWRGVDRSGERSSWTSLAEERGGEVDRFALLGALLPALRRRIAAIEFDPSALLAAYRRVCVTLGQDVQAQGAAGPPVVGRAVDVDALGRLLVDTDAGRVAVSAGDVVEVRPPG